MVKTIKKLKKINLVDFFKLEKVETNLIIFLTLVVFVLINILVANLSIRFDFSVGQAYTLSSSTKRILKNLDDLVSVKFFVSSDLPTRLLPLKNEVLDFLNEYKKTAKKINFKILDPKKDEKALTEAQEIGLPALQFSQLEKDRYQITNVYFGIVISYGDKKEIIPQVSDLESLEYNITSAIYKLTKKELDKVAVLGREQKFNSQEDELLSFKKTAEKQFILDFIDVSTSSANKKIDSFYKTILVFDNNQKNYNNQEISAIKDYLKNKGRAIFFIDGVWVLDNLQTSEAKHSLFNLLATDWGIELKKNLVLSTSAELVNFGNELIQFFTPYYFWLKTANFNNKSSYFSNIQQLTFPWTSSIKLKDKKNFKYEVLVKTNKSSWEQKENFILDPQNIPQPEKKETKEFNLVVEAENKDGGKIVVIPSSRFILERYLTRTSDNLEFVLNVLNNLASAGALSGIRQRAVSFYPLPELSEVQKDLFKYLNIFLLPSLLALVGGIKLIRTK
ncbi:MAG: GldG family protein [Patescibacteria group bacterium]|nr:GldG family protein [Patescibacteria group bacterium]